MKITLLILALLAVAGAALASQHLGLIDVPVIGEALEKITGVEAASDGFPTTATE